MNRTSQFNVMDMRKSQIERTTQIDPPFTQNMIQKLGKLFEIYPEGRIKDILATAKAIGLDE